MFAEVILQSSLACQLVTGKKNASFQGWRFLEIVVHLIPAHYPFSARGIEKQEYQK